MAETPDLVERLRKGSVAYYTPSGGPVFNGPTDLEAEAADTISSQARRIEELEAALRPFRRLADCTDDEPDGASVTVNVNRARDARRTLTGNDDGE